MYTICSFNEVTIIVKTNHFTNKHPVTICNMISLDNWICCPVYTVKTMKVNCLDIIIIERITLALIDMFNWWFVGLAIARRLKPFGVKRLLYTGRQPKPQAQEVDGEYGKKRHEIAWCNSIYEYRWNKTIQRGYEDCMMASLSSPLSAFRHSGEREWFCGGVLFFGSWHSKPLWQNLLQQDEENVCLHQHQQVKHIC